MRLPLLAFGSSVATLVAGQILLRRLSLLLPVDLTAYVTLLGIQFLSMALGFAIGLLIPAAWVRPRTLAGLFVLEGLLCLAIIRWDFSLAAGAAFFLLSALATLCLFRFSKNSAKLNFVIYAGSALGLLLVEKIFFRFWSVQSILGGVALIFTVLALFCNGAKSATQQPGKPSGARSAIVAFTSGLILFGGLVISYRLLRIYLRNTSDVAAEVTAISMFIGAVMSYYYARISGQGLIPRFLLLMTAPLIFIITAQNLDQLTQIPREFFILFLLVGLSGWSSFLYNDAFADAAPVPVLLWNTLGSFCGALTFGFYLVPEFKLAQAFNIFQACFLIGSACMLFSTLGKIGDKKIRMLAQMGIMTFIVLGGLTFLNTRWYERQWSALALRLAPGENILATAETPQDIWLLTRKGNDHRLIQNSHSMSGTHFTNRRYMKLMAYLGEHYNPHAKSALNIGFGTGLTAQALLENKKLELLDVSDITRDIEKLTKIVYQTEKSPDPLGDPRLKYHLGGARNFLRHSRQKYDIITGEPPPPANSSIAYLYTVNFYQDVLAHLSDNGVFTYWLPTHSVSDSAAARIWTTFQAVFPQSELFAGTESNLIMVGFANQKPSQDKRFFQPHWLQETGIASAEELAELRIDPALPPGPVLTDDFSYIEEDYVRPDRKPWGLPEFTARPQIYVADVTVNPYVALVALEKNLARKPSQAAIERLLISDNPLRKEFISYLAGTDFTGARKFLANHPDKIKQDELLCAWMIMLDRLLGRHASEIKRDAVLYAQGRGGVTSLFKAYVDHKLPPEYYPGQGPGH